MPDSGGSEPAGTTQITQNRDPWSGQQPYITKGFERAESDLLNTPRSMYPNSMVVPFSNQTEQALGMTENRALQGSPALQAGNQAIANTASGQYLNSNPYLQSAIDAASSGITRNYQNAVAPGIDSAAASAGRYGSGAQANMHSQAQQNLAQQLGQVGAAMSYQGYGDERTNQLRAAALSPTMAQADYMDAGQLATVGQSREQMAGQNLQEQIDRYNFGQEEPRQRLAEYMAMVAGGNFGGSATQTQPYFQPSGLQTGLGVAATGAGIAGSLFGANGLWGAKGIFGGT